MASIFFISTAPRPYIQPSLMTPENGSTLQSAAFAGTTSMCPWTTRPGKDGLEPSTRATTEQRFGALS